MSVNHRRIQHLIFTTRHEKLCYSAPKLSSSDVAHRHCVKGRRFAGKCINTVYKYNPTRLYNITILPK